MEFVRGQKAKVGDLTPATSFELGVAARGPGMDVDISCFGLDANGKLSDDRYFIFYNQTSSPCGSLTLRGQRAGYNQVFQVDLGRIPSTIRRLVITATVDGATSMSGLQDSRIDLLVGDNAVGTFKFSGADFGAEKAIMVAEIYHKDIWRFAAIGQGFNGGLSALLAHFGGEEMKDPAPPPAAPPPRAPEPPAPKVNLGKVTLDKRGAQKTVNLKKGGGTQLVHINLNWDNPAPKRGLFGMSKPNNVDLDLGCMFRMADGSIGVIQPLGNRFGDRAHSPFIYLDKDDRSGAATDGENLYILRPDLIDKVVVFAMIYEGTANFSTVNARLNIVDQGGSEILIPLNSPDPSRLFCAVCVIQKRGEGIEITKEEQYFPGHAQCDQQYGFGFRWVAGSK